MIGKAIVSLLRNDATITTLVGNRILPAPIEQGTEHPCIVYAINNRPVTNCDNGNSIVVNEITIGAYGGTVAAMEAICTNIKRVLNLYKGIVADVNVQGIFLTAESEDRYDEDYRTRFIQQQYTAITLN